MVGKEIYEELIGFDELPTELVQQELTELLGRYGKNLEQVTLEELRPILADYLREILGALNEDS